MPYAIEGLDKTLKALRKYSPDLYKQMNKEIRVELKDLRDKARSLVPSEITGLSSWAAHETKYDGEGKRASFPQYEPTAARRGITYSIGRQRPNRSGWAAYYTLFNRSASGAIIETAGRKNPLGSNTSRSRNPYAGRHFIGAINQSVGSMKSVGKGHSRKFTGRLIYRVVAEDEGQVRYKIIKAISTAANNFNYRKAA